jgi:hypothetical protein
MFYEIKKWKFSLPKNTEAYPIQHFSLPEINVIDLFLAFLCRGLLDVEGKSTGHCGSGPGDSGNSQPETKIMNCISLFLIIYYNLKV